MSEDTKQPGSEEPTLPGVSDSEASGTPPPSAIPPAGVLAGADEEKAAMVEQAKTRVAAVKESLGEKATPAATTPGAPKAPVKKKDEGPKPVDAGNHPLVKNLKEKFGEAVLEASEFLGQLSIVVNAAQIQEICESLRDDAETPFNYLSDLTCVHYPDNKATPFEVVYQLYSISKNERVRLKIDAKIG